MNEEDVDDIITVLNNALQVEYADIVNWPRWVNRITNPSAVEKLRRLARDSMKHFNTISSIIRQIGGTPSWGFDLDLKEDEPDLEGILTGQLHREKLAKMGYRRAAELTTDDGFRRVFMAQAAEEDEHIALCEEVLAELSSSES